MRLICTGYSKQSSTCNNSRDIGKCVLASIESLGDRKIEVRCPRNPWRGSNARYVGHVVEAQQQEKYEE